MLLKNIDIEEIIEIIGLTQEEVKKLNNSKIKNIS